MDASLQEYYNAIVRVFNQQQSLRPFFMNTQMVGFTETCHFFYLSSSSLSDYIQSSYVDNITISPLILLNETSASFVINGFEQVSTFTSFPIKAIAVNIKKIENTSFAPLNGKTVIDFIAFSPYSKEDFLRIYHFKEFFNTNIFNITNFFFLNNNVI